METYNFQSVTILVADGNQYMLRLLNELLRSFGFKNIIRCENGTAALAAMKTDEIDIVICDLLMAPFDGLEFTKLTRQAPNSRNKMTPIIMLTGHSEQFRVEDARNVGVTEFLVKPISPTILWQRLVYVVENPRTFVTSDKFVGPNRRRHLDDYEGDERRGLGSESGTLDPAEVAALLDQNNSDTAEIDQ